MNDILDSNRAAQLEKILAHWAIPPVQSIESIYEGSRVFKINTAGRTFSLKDISHAPNLLRLEFTRDVLTHVAQAGLQVPVPLLTRAAECAVPLDGPYYLLTEFIPAGENPTAPELQPELFFQVGRAIARLHQALATYSDSKVKGRTWRQDLAGQVPQWLADLGEGLPEPQSAIVQRMARERGAATERALQGLPEQLIHRDCHPGNILVQGTNVVGFIDCDHICVAPRVFDLAYYAVHHLKWVTNDAQATGRWLNNLPFLMQGYQSISSLSPAEVAAVPHAMLAYHLLLSHWFMGRGQMEPIGREVQALDWIHSNFDAIVDALQSA